MTTITYKFGSEEYTILLDRVPGNSLLDVLTRSPKAEKDDEGNIIIKVDDPNIGKVIAYLNNPIPTTDAELEKLLDYYGVYEYTDYRSVYRPEKYIRDHMYRDGFEDHPMNTDPYYHLIRVTPELYESLPLSTDLDRNDLLFSQVKLTKRPWQDVQADLEQIDHLFSLITASDRSSEVDNEEKEKVDNEEKEEIDNGREEEKKEDVKPTPRILVAGGYIFSALFGTQSSDIDIFLTSMNEIDAMNVIQKYRADCEHDEVIRTQSAISFKHSDGSIYQFILRLYKSPSEVLHGFDVDSCCMGYDGQDVYLTPRCLYSLFKGYNTVNFDLLSSSYEYRLAKYATRGVAICVPKFDRNKVDEDVLQKEYNRCFSYADLRVEAHRLKQRIKQRLLRDGFVEHEDDLEDLWYSQDIIAHTYITAKERKEWHRIHQEIRQFGGGFAHNNMDTMYKTRCQGLNLLLLLEKRFLKKGSHPRVRQTYEKLAQEHSDYSPLPYCAYSTEGNSLWYIVRYLVERRREYKDVWVPIQHLVSQIEEWLGLNKKYRKVTTVNFPLNKHIAFLKTNLQNYDLIMDLPDCIYQLLDHIGSVDIGKTPTFKITNPGEQMTNTFHQIVLEDNQMWYEGPAYHD